MTTEATTPTRPARRSRLVWVVLALAGLFVLACADDGGDDASNGDATPTSASDAGGAGAEGEAAPDGGDAAASGAACKDTPATENLDTVGQSLYTGRPDTQGNDHEAELGDCVRLAGYTAYVDSAAMVTPEFGDPELVVTVRVQNRDDKAKSYNVFDWKLQTENGQVLDPTFSMATTNDLSSGDLVTGGEVSGEVAFDVPPGTYFVIYKPDAFNDARGIWQITG